MHTKHWITTLPLLIPWYYGKEGIKELLTNRQTAADFRCGGISTRCRDFMVVVLSFSLKAHRK